MIQDIDDEGVLLDKYKLNRDGHKVSDYHYNRNCGYETLVTESRISFSKADLESESRIHGHVGFFESAVIDADIDDIASIFHDSQGVELEPDKAVSLLNKIITLDLDREIKAYFQSNYAVLWFKWDVEAGGQSSSSVINRWHCDLGPTTHLKSITYFDSSADHGAKLFISGEDASRKLKDLGYLLSDINTCRDDIEDLCDFYDVDIDEHAVSFKSGDTACLNPNQRMYKVSPPTEGYERRCLVVCYIPSPMPWQELAAQGFHPHHGEIAFDHAAKKILQISNSVKLSNNSSEEPWGRVTMNESELIELDPNAKIKTPASLRHHLKQMFDDENYIDRIYNSIITSSSNLDFTIQELMIKLKESFQRDLKWGGVFDVVDHKNLSSLIRFEGEYIDSYLRYNKADKPVPEAIMWPDPSHEKYPQNRLNMTPYVVAPKIMDITTPVSSCGSCFAFEISKVLQEQGFNYVIEERPDDKSLGVFVNHYDAGDKYVNFSASYGILFNTPTLLQLAQKAFGLRKFEKYCLQTDEGLYMDPYRETVFFNSKTAFLNDYPKHIDALRRTLLNAKVMIFTAGLNECWMMRDGTVISRNPRQGLYQLVKHHVLTVEENVKAMKDFVNIVRQYNPDFKLVISLSPVPFLATGRANTHHILEANTHSKSVLRVAIDQVVTEMEGVYYLPSYELVKECSENPWQADDRHVTRETVSRVVNMFKDMFVN